MNHCEYMNQVIELSINHDIQGEISWNHSKTGEAYAFVNCNDLFAWGVADGVTLKANRIPLLEKAIDECVAIAGRVGESDGTLLFCARMRKMRPQGAFYTYFDKRLWHLFNACGPERIVGPGNPYEQGEYRKSVGE